MYIKFIIILIIVFLAIYYIFTFIKIKNKRKGLDGNSLDFKSDDYIKFDNKNMMDEDIIKIDYIDREELHKIIQDEIHSEEDVKNNRTIRKIEF